MEICAFECPHCRRRYRVSADKRGHRIACKQCGRPLRVPVGHGSVGVGHRKQPGVQPTRALGHRRTNTTAAAVLLAVVAAPVGLFVLSNALGERRTPVPTDTEPLVSRESRIAISTASSAYRESRYGSAYTTEWVADSAVVRHEIVHTLEELVEAAGEGEMDRVVELFNFDRIVPEVTRWVDRRPSEEERRKFIRGLRMGFKLGKKAIPSWKEARVRAVRFHPSRREAEVHCVMRMSDGRPSLAYRLWMIEHDGRWQVFDWESLEIGGMGRFSFNMGALIAARGETSEPDLLKVQRMLNAAATLVVAGQPRRALDQIARLRDFREPHPLAPLIDSTEALARAEVEDYETALELCEAALDRNEELMGTRLLRALVLLELERYQEASQAARSCLSMLGDDPAGLLMLGQALLGLGDRAAAGETHRRGIAADPEYDAANRFALAEVVAREHPADALELLQTGFRKTIEIEREEARAWGSVLLEEAGAFAELGVWSAPWTKESPQSAAAWFYFGLAERHSGRMACAESSLSKARSLVGEETVIPRYEVEMAILKALQGSLADARNIIRSMEEYEQTEGFRHYATAALEAINGDNEASLGELELAFAEDGWLAELADRDAVFTNVREDEGYATLSAVRRQAGVAGGPSR